MANSDDAVLAAVGPRLRAVRQRRGTTLAQLLDWRRDTPDDKGLTPVIKRERDAMETLRTVLEPAPPEDAQ